MLAVLSGCSQRLPTLTVTFFDVGKGDCILLECDGHAAMIDAGFDNTANNILSALADKGIDTLDFLLLTHMDKDHVGGADKFLENLTIGAVYAPDYEKDAKQYQQYVDALAKLKSRCSRRSRQPMSNPTITRFWRNWSTGRRAFCLRAMRRVCVCRNIYRARRTRRMYSRYRTTAAGTRFRTISSRL